MHTPVLRLYPPPALELPLEGLYLGHALRRSGGARPLVYTNFLASLDGRVSETDARGRRRVPAALANPRDWRLYLELLAQADAVLTSSRHLRALADGRLGELLSFPEAHRDLGIWRRDRDLLPHPLCVAVSRDLDIPAAALRERHPGPLLVLTGDAAPRQRIRALERAGIEVDCVNAGAAVEGGAAVRALGRRGIAGLYSIAGPRVLHTLLQAGVLDRLYLTLGHRLIGGRGFDTLVNGAALAPPRSLRLDALHLDPGAGQSFAVYSALSPTGEQTR